MVLASICIGVRTRLALAFFFYFGLSEALESVFFSFVCVGSVNMAFKTPFDSFPRGAPDFSVEHLQNFFVDCVCGFEKSVTSRVE